MILLLFSMLGCSEGATIVMLPAPGRSHFLVFERVAEELTDRGYEVWLLVLSEKKVGMLCQRKLNSTDLKNSDILHVVYDFFFHFFHLKCILEVFISKYSSCKAWSCKRDVMNLIGAEMLSDVLQRGFKNIRLNIKTFHILPVPWRSLVKSTDLSTYKFKSSRGYSYECWN